LTNENRGAEAREENFFSHYHALHSNENCEALPDLPPVYEAPAWEREKKDF
jgi:hypothetical protein